MVPPVVPVRAAPLAEYRQAEGPAAGGRAGSPARTAIPAGSATRAMGPSPMARRARPGRRELSVTTSPARFRRAGPAGDGDSRLPAPGKPAVSPALRGRPRERQWLAPVSAAVAVTLPAAADGRA